MQKWKFEVEFMEPPTPGEATFRDDKIRTLEWKQTILLILKF